MISIVIPVYNEGPPLKNLCAEIIKVIKSQFDSGFTIFPPVSAGAKEMPGNYEIILVDDRSTDNSWTVMKALAAGDVNIKIARLCRNFGQHSALTAGLSLTQYEYVVMMDCDGQDEPQNIIALYDTLLKKNVQIVYAKRKNRKDGALKRAASLFVNRIMQGLSGVKHDPEIGTFRIMKRTVVDAYLSMPEKNRFIGGMFYWLNFESATVDVVHQPRASGKSNYNFRKMVKLARLGILSSSTKLLSIGIYIGLITSILSVVAGAYFLSLKFIYDVPLGFTAVIVSIFFVGSIIMLLLGIMGEYMREIFEEVKARPNYIVEEKINF